MTLPLFALRLQDGDDLVAARQRARDVAGALGFSPQDGIRIATTVSELARGALHHARGARLEFAALRDGAGQLLRIRVADQGPGIAALGDILSGRAAPADDGRAGPAVASRLMDSLEVDADASGTCITLTKRLPQDAPPLDAPRAGQIAARLAQADAPSSLDELQRQNEELVATLASLRERQDEMTHLALELEDTNRGVLALYAELEGQADALRAAGDMKSRFLSHMSHEFRTPLNSIRALARLLLAETDGPLGVEQRRQVDYIVQAADELGGLVDDLLDLAKIEAGKVEVRVAEFEIGALFGALRGMMRPLLAGDAVELVFEEPPDPPRIASDEAKVAQILRNLISNALKFTPSGEVRVACRRWPDDVSKVELSVTDTGIGIAPEHLDVIFDEFTQVDSALQRVAHGTGLGLPLCRRLAALLGGTIHVGSRPGAGSRFAVVLPIGLPPAPPARPFHSKHESSDR